MLCRVSCHDSSKFPPSNSLMFVVALKLLPKLLNKKGDEFVPVMPFHPVQLDELPPLSLTEPAFKLGNFSYFGQTNSARAKAVNRSPLLRLAIREGIVGVLAGFGYGYFDQNKAEAYYRAGQC